MSEYYQNSPRVEPPPVNREATQDEGALAYVQGSTLAANPYIAPAEGARYVYWREGWFDQQEQTILVNVALDLHSSVCV